MEKLASEIENFLHEKLELYRELTTVLHMESDYIVKMDVDSLWAASSRKKELTVDIEKQRKDILSLLNHKGIAHGMDMGNFNVSGLIRSLPVSSKIKASLEKTAITIASKKEELKNIAASNRRYIQEYLGVIEGVMSTITNATQQKSYGRKGLSGTSPSFYGTRYGRTASTSLISAQV